MGVGGGTSLQNRGICAAIRIEYVVYINQWMSNCSDLYNFNYKQEDGPLQMFGPANGVGNYLAQEKIYSVC